MILRMHRHRKAGDDRVRVRNGDLVTIEFCLCGAERRANEWRWHRDHGITRAA